MSRYEDLDEQGQVAVVTQAARLALPLLGIEAQHVGLVTHAYNTTFAVDLVAGGRVAVRVLVNSIADDAHVRGQLAWAQALAVAGVPVPPPWFGPGGEDVVVVRPEGAGRDFRVCASWWVTGTVHPEITTDQTHAIGVLPVHGDLHAGNLLWEDGRVEPYVLDLDDAVVASPAHDIAVTAFYTRRSGDPEAMTRLFAGYAEHAALPPVSSSIFEGLVAARQLTLTASLLATVTPSFRAEAEAYLTTTTVRLRHYHDDGVLDSRLTAAG